MKEALDGLAINVGDKIAGSKAGLKCWTALVNLHDQVMHGVEVGVAEVDANGSNGEAEPLGAASDNDGGVQGVDEGGQVPAW